MRKFLIIIVKTLLGIISVIISLCLIIIAVFFILNDTYRFSPIARDFLNKNIDGEIYFDSLKLHFRDFPVIGVSIVNGMLIADTDLFPNDTLCQVKKLHASVDPFMIMKDNLIYIPEAYIDQGKAHVILNEHGRPDWAIWHFIKKKKNVEGEKEKTKKTKGPIKLNIQHVYLTNSPVFYYKNHHTGLELSAGAEIGRASCRERVSAPV